MSQKISSPRSLPISAWASEIEKILDHHFPSPPIPLFHDSPYTLLIAVLLSAQSTDERVNRITPLLFRLAKTPEEMIQLPVEQIEEIIRPIGLSPRKSKAIWNLSKDLVTLHNSEVPKTFEALEALDGVGHKTASVVLAQAFDIPAFPVDTHILRSANRWKLITSKSVVKTEKVLKGLFPEENWNKIHLQIIFFARKFCPAKGHQPHLCPICKLL